MTGRIPLIALTSIAVGILLGSCSREPAPEHAPHESTTGSAPPLFENLGSHRHSVTTSNAIAQQYFDQGLRLVYGFNHDEAERAFREAARLDPQCAMAWWGVAVALGPNINLPLDAARNQRALDAVQKAQALIPNVNARERAYIAAIAARYAADPTADRAKLDRAYSDAMKRLSQLFPDDNDAAVLYAESLMDLRPWQLWTPDGKPHEDTEEIVRVLETVLGRDANHPGANHYYIHAVEASPTPAKAAASAERLKTLVPGAGHLVHMPAHVFMRVGDYKGAIESNADAARVDADYIARTKAQGIYPLMYYTHNFMFLSAAAGMTGQSREALEAAAKAVEIAAPMAGHEAMAEYVLPWSLFAMARFAKWDDILAASRPADSTPMVRALWHYARGMAHAGKGDLNGARQDRSELESARSKVPADAAFNINRSHDVLKVAAEVLDARLAGASGDRTLALAHWKKAVEAQDRLNYDEPPAWYFPVRESLGGEYLRARHFAEAEEVFRRDLLINPNNPRSLFGLREALRGQSKNADDASRRFEDAWKNADVQVSVETL